MRDTPLHAAAEQNCPEVCKLLIVLGKAKVDMVNKVRYQKKGTWEGDVVNKVRYPKKGKWEGDVVNKVRCKTEDLWE